MAAEGARAAVDAGDVLALRDAAEFEAWMAEHVEQRLGVWIKIAKKGSGVASLTEDEAVDLGLCYGWISGQRKACDEVYYLQRYVPRRPRSRWSQVNVRKGRGAQRGRAHAAVRSRRGRGRQGRRTVGRHHPVCAPPQGHDCPGGRRGVTPLGESDRRAGPQLAATARARLENVFASSARPQTYSVQQPTTAAAMA
jgi:hypothetical protein